MGTPLGLGQLAGGRLSQVARGPIEAGGRETCDVCTLEAACARSRPEGHARSKPGGDPLLLPSPVLGVC